MSALFMVKMFLRAKTPEEIIAKQIEQNLKDGITHKYQEVIKDGKGWIIWYLADATKFVKKPLVSLLKVETKGTDGTR